jgi:OmcA/MtrC family decaheme c-type cytochrome
MNRFNHFFRWSWTFLVAVTLTMGLAGCDGDDGATGPAGAAGTDGSDGSDGDPGLACWDLNENGLKDLPDEDINGDGVVDVNDCAGASASATPLESCGVCHDVGSVADAGPAHALPPIESVSNVAFAVNGADLDVTFDVAADGVAATGYDEVQRAYRNNGGTRTDVCNAPDRSSPCDPASVTLTDNGGGNYTIKVLGGAAEAATNNRWLLRVQNSAERETRTYFYADFPASPFAADVSPVAVTATACANCHGPEGIPVHGSAFIASDGGEPCLVCHGSDESDDPEVVPSLVAVAHGYHSGVAAWEDPIEEIEITYPTYMTNCSVCHSEDAQLAATNAMPVSGEGCFTCHGSMASWNFAGPPDLTFHLTLTPTPDTADCQVCHSVGGAAADKVVVTDFHNGATTERGGVIWDGEDTSVTEGALFNWQITGVADDGANLTITWQASYNGAGVDPCNATPGAGTPAFFAIPPFVRPDGSEQNRNNMSILRNYAQGEDFILGTVPGSAGNSAGQPDSGPNLDDINTTCAGNVATTVVPVQETDAMYGRVAIQGKPWVVAVDPDDADGVMQVRAKTPTFDWVVGEGGKAPNDRRVVADTGLCLQCHVGSLYQHGGNRVDNIDMCYLCHNPAANDEYVRVNEFGVDASESYDGRAGQAFGIKEMVHSVHPAGELGNPVVIYRGRGIYGWATSVDQLRNWPTEDNCTRSNGSPGRLVVGSEDAPADGSDPCQPHNFHAPTYPRGLYDCAACHVATVDLLPDAKKAMATTVEAGQPPFGDQKNDVLQGVQTTSCITCHADSAAKGHAYQNSWTPQTFPEGRQTIIDAN